MASDGRDIEPSPPPGVVELREDAPLKAGGASSARCCAGGPRLILGSFAALSAAITLALLTQIHFGDYEVVPHGSVASSAAACSRAGTDALKAGGRATDAAAAAALCLAVVAPHRTSLDAGGSMLYWEYRQSRSQLPTLAEWGGVESGAGSGAESGAERPPRLLLALAALHAKRGALPWAQVLRPAVQLARGGFVVSEGLAAAERAAGGDGVAGERRAVPELADYLETLQRNTSAELAEMWRSWGSAVTETSPLSTRAGGGGVAAVRAWAGGGGAAQALAALGAALQAPAPDPDLAIQRAAQSLLATPPVSATGGVASGLAVVDSRDTYLALVTGLSAPFGSGAPAAGWRRDAPLAPLDLAPAILADDYICGTRYVIGAESAAALAQGAAALAASGAPAAVERARLALAPAPLAEALRPAPPPLAALAKANATPPYAALNLVQQRGDALLSYADSRGGGLASRF